MSTPFCVSPPNLAHRTKKHRKTCSKHRSPPLTSLPAVTPPHLMYSSVGRTTLSAPTHAYRTRTLSLSCHSEEHPKGTCFAARSDVGIRSPRPQARNSLPPSAREVARSAGGRDVDPPPPRCSSVGGDAHIAPHTAPAVSFRASDRRHWRGNPSPRPQARNTLAADCPKGHSAPASAGYFCPRRQKCPKAPFKPAV